VPINLSPLSAVTGVVTYLRSRVKARSLGATLDCLPKQVDILSSIELACLQRSGVQGIILDLDNTLISEDDRYLSPNMEDWIDRAKQHRLKLFILSNSKRRYRVKRWSHRLGVPAISPARKPFPFSFAKALSHMQLSPEQVVVIGDSRHTDMLGAWLMGCASIQVATLPHPARWWEKLFGVHVQIPYPPHGELIAHIETLEQEL